MTNSGISTLSAAYLDEQGYQRAIPPPSRPRMTRSLRHIAIALLLAAGPLLGMRFVAAYAVNAPVNDEWAFLGLLQRLSDRTLSIQDLVQPYNEHVVPVFYVLWLALAGITRYNTLAANGVGFVMLCLTVACMYRVYRRGSNGSLVAFIPISLLLFSTRNVEIFLSPPQLSSTLSNLAAVSALLLLSQTRTAGLRLGMAISLAVVGSLSFGSGLYAWPAGSLQMLLRRRVAGHREVQWLSIVVWSLSGLGLLAWYVFLAASALSFSLAPTQSSSVLHVATSALLYLMTVIGAAVAVEPFAAKSAGMILAVVYTVVSIVLIRHAWRRQNGSETGALPLSVLCFALLSVASIALARWHVSEQIGPLTPRYAAFSTLAVAALCVLLQRSDVLPRSGILPIRHAVFALVAVGLVSGVTWAESAGSLWRSDLMWKTYQIATYQQQSDQVLGPLYLNNAATVRKRSEFMEREKLGVFADVRTRLRPVTRAARSGLGSVEAINGQPVQATTETAPLPLNAAHGSLVVIEGWAVDATSEGPGKGLVISVDNDRTVFGARYPLPRPDVSAFYHHTAYAASGFLASFSADALSPGLHVITVKLITDDDGEFVELPSMVWIKVVNPGGAP